MAVDSTSGLEVELAGLLAAACRGDHGFLSRLLHKIEAHRPDKLSGVEIVQEFVTSSNRRYDVFLTRDEPKLSVVFELKRGRSGLGEDQLKEYLSLLGILHGTKLQPARNRPKTAKLVVITGDTELPSVVSDLHKAGRNGFLQNHLAWCSWFEVADLLRCPEGEEPADSNAQTLLKRLRARGYITDAASLPQLRLHDKAIGAILKCGADEDFAEERNTFENALGRVEFEMGRIGFGPLQQVQIKRRKKTSKRAAWTSISDSSMTLLGNKLQSKGQLFLPNTELDRIYTGATKNWTKAIGVGVGYSLSLRDWVAFIRPAGRHSVTQEFLEGLSTRNRQPITKAGHGVNGWVLRGDQRQPKKTAAFLARAWNSFNALLDNSP